MVTTLLDPARMIVQTLLRDSSDRAKVGIARLGLSVVAAGLLGSAGLVALTEVVGYPVAAIVFAVIFGLLALAAHLTGRVLAARQAQRMALARNRMTADLALGTSVLRSALPILPVLAGLAVFSLVRRK
jgi:ABC-type transport system involved in cytochrome c biogenesis permease subunit